MSLRSSELEQVVEDVSARLVGAVVQKAWCPLPRLAYLELRVPGRSVLLCLCAEGELSRLSVAEERFPTPGEPAPFQRWLRHELTGARLAGARHEAARRCVTLDFVIPQYRDFKIGRYLFQEEREFFRSRGIAEIVSEPGTPRHAAYLRRMGFSPSAAGGDERYSLAV